MLRVLHVCPPVAKLQLLARAIRLSLSGSSILLIGCSRSNEKNKYLLDILISDDVPRAMNYSGGQKC